MGSLDRSTLVTILVPGRCRPLPIVAVHIVEPEPVRALATHAMRPVIGVPVVPADLIESRLSVTRGVLGVSIARTAAGVFPFFFGGKARTSESGWAGTRAFRHVVGIENRRFLIPTTPVPPQPFTVSAQPVSRVALSSALDGRATAATLQRPDATGCWRGPRPPWGFEEYPLNPTGNDNRVARVWAQHKPGVVAQGQRIQ